MAVELPNLAQSVLEITAQKKFSFSAEIIPPRNGADFQEVFTQIEALKQAGFDFISVTHGAGGSLRGGTLPICYHAQHSLKMTSIAHLTVRGSSAEDLENALIDHHYFGIRNILALRGDPPDGLGAKFTAPAGGYSYAHELISLISDLNQGRYKLRPHFDKNFSKEEFRQGIPTSFCIGAASYPDDKKDIRISYLQKKVEAGAKFSITQMTLDQEHFFDFHDEVREKIDRNFVMFPGIRIPHSLKMLQRLSEKFSITVEKSLIEEMLKVKDDSAQLLAVGKRWAKSFIGEAMRHNVKGVHFFIMGDAQPAIEVKKYFS